jgi:hypothetical protein
MEDAKSIDRYLAGKEVSDARDRLRDWRLLVASLRPIGEAIQAERREAIEKRVPKLNQHLTRAYQLMTRQKSFPDARIRVRSTPSSSNSWGIELEVGLESRGRWFTPQAHLNNQAWNAIQILPFLAFRKLKLLDHEIELFIVDDPSQSFDTPHVRAMMTLLAEVAESTQLILATYDESRFRPLADELFPKGTSVIVTVPDFDPEKGPVVRSDLN